MVEIIFFIFSKSRDLDHVTFIFLKKLKFRSIFQQKNEVKER